MNKIFIITLALCGISAANAQANCDADKPQAMKHHSHADKAAMNAETSREHATSDQDATQPRANADQTNYNDKTLANYQDPYLTNPRGYKSNEYGEAAPAPKRNVFVSRGEETYAPSAGYDTEIDNRNDR